MIGRQLTFKSAWLAKLFAKPETPSLFVETVAGAVGIPYNLARQTGVVAVIQSPTGTALSTKSAERSGFIKGALSNL